MLTGSPPPMWSSAETYSTMLSSSGIYPTTVVPRSQALKSASATPKMAWLIGSSITLTLPWKRRTRSELIAIGSLINFSRCASQWMTSSPMLGSIIAILPQSRPSSRTSSADTGPARSLPLPPLLIAPRLMTASISELPLGIPSC